MKEKFEYIPTSIRLTVDQKQALKDEATRKGLTFSELLREKLFEGESHV